MNVQELKLRVASPIVAPEAANFRPTQWPPAADFPVVINANGQVVSCYGDPIWDLSCWGNKRITLNFGDAVQRNGRHGAPIDAGNAQLLRKIVFWWLYGDQQVCAPATYAMRFTMIRPLIVLCSKNGVLASELMRFPRVMDRLHEVIIPSKANQTLTLLHQLHEARDRLGFTLLDREGLRHLAVNTAPRNDRQTAYIPPRIWAYQVRRLREFLEDFHAHQEAIVSCYHDCLDAYAAAYGSLAESFSAERKKGSGLAFRSGSPQGSFREKAVANGIDSLLARWVRGYDEADQQLRGFSSYLSSVVQVSVCYTINFSLMRIGEVASLRSDCLLVENDRTFGPIYLLRGETKKTIEDPDALWVTSPAVKLAIDAMAAVARLRMTAARANPSSGVSEEDFENPFLITRVHEPWAMVAAPDTSIKVEIGPYQALVEKVPGLFDAKEILITDEDLQLARLVTPSLDRDRYSVGQCWSFRYHQLRRTGAVNMQASGLVSEASLQYQLKHVRRAMSLYYGQGYTRLVLNRSVQGEYVRAMYETMSHDFMALMDEKFISPFGPQHKRNLLGPVAVNDVEKLQSEARLGRIAFRETLLGGCTSPSPCEYGGIDNIAQCCGGGEEGPCPRAFIDKRKKGLLCELRNVIDGRLESAASGSPLRSSLEAQRRSMSNALDIIENEETNVG